MKTLTATLTSTILALATLSGGCDPDDVSEELDGLEALDPEDREGPDALQAEEAPDPDKLELDADLPMLAVDESDPLFGLQDGQVKVYNLCASLSLYQYNPAYHGTPGNPSVEVGQWKKLIWQTLSGTPSGWATVLSAGQEYWGWRYARVECLGGSW